MDCQVKEVLRHETFLINKANYRSENKMSFTSLIESERVKRKFVYDSNHKINSLFDIQRVTQVHIVFMTNLKLRVRNQKGDIVFGDCSSDTLFYDDGFAQSVCVLECPTLRYLTKPMPLTNTVKQT